MTIRATMDLPQHRTVWGCLASSLIEHRRITLGEFSIA